MTPVGPRTVEAWLPVGWVGASGGASAGGMCDARGGDGIERIAGRRRWRTQRYRAGPAVSALVAGVVAVTPGSGAADVVGIVLGAGASRRLGRPKQTLPLGDTTLLGHAVRNAEAASSLDRVVVVLGGAADQAWSSVRPRRARAVVNTAYGDGCAASLLAGLDAAGGAAAVVMLLGDMPAVAPATVDTLVHAWRAAPSWAAVVAYDDGLGHPLLFSAAAFPDVRALHGDKAVWRIVDREPEDRVRRVRVAGPVPADVDTWDDYTAVCRSVGFVPPPGLATGWTTTR